MTDRVRLCEAAAMDAARFGNWDDSVPPCDEPGAVQFEGYLLCQGCVEALQLIRRIFERYLSEGAE